MDLIDIHRFVTRTRFPAHRVKELMTHREPAPIYTMGSPPSEEQVKRRLRIDVVKRQRLVILVDDVGGKLPAQDLVENGLGIAAPHTGEHTGENRSGKRKNLTNGLE